MIFAAARGRWRVVSNASARRDCRHPPTKTHPRLLEDVGADEVRHVVELVHLLLLLHRRVAVHDDRDGLRAAHVRRRAGVAGARCAAVAVLLAPPARKLRRCCGASTHCSRAHFGGVARQEQTPWRASSAEPPGSQLGLVLSGSGLCAGKTLQTLAWAVRASAHH